jgi:hypothetical protein
MNGLNADRRTGQRQHAAARFGRPDAGARPVSVTYPGAVEGWLHAGAPRRAHDGERLHQQSATPATASRSAKWSLVAARPLTTRARRRRLPAGGRAPRSGGSSATLLARSLSCWLAAGTLPRRSRAVGRHLAGGLIDEDDFAAARQTGSNPSTDFGDVSRRRQGVVVLVLASRKSVLGLSTCDSHRSSKRSRSHADAIGSGGPDPSIGCARHADLEG